MYPFTSRSARAIHSTSWLSCGESKYIPSTRCLESIQNHIACAPLLQNTSMLISVVPQVNSCSCLTLTKKFIHAHILECNIVDNIHGTGRMIKLIIGSLLHYAQT